MTTTTVEGWASRLSGTWESDPNASRVSFRARSFGIIPVAGNVPLVSASVDISPGPTLHKLEATLAAGGFHTGNPRRDEHVRSGSFLDAGRFPEIVFTAGDLVRDGDTWRLDGALTVRGVTRPQTLTLDTDRTRGPDESDRLRVRARTIVDRKAFGVSAEPFIVGRTLRVDIDVLLVRPAFPARG